MRKTPFTLAGDRRAASTTRRRLALVGLSLVAVAGLAACGDDSDDTAEPVSSTTVPDAPSTVTIRLVDFGFEDVPESVPAGTRLEIVNESESELHELVAFRVPDDEERSLSEIMALPQEESLGILGEPAAVLLQAPGGETIPAVGDGTLAEPGRYCCSVPSPPAPTRPPTSRPRPPARAARPRSPVARPTSPTGWWPSSPSTDRPPSNAASC
jgi:hypothetical protein